MEDLRNKHRMEQRELQSRITQRKKNATKKTRRGINEECERSQRELHDRQQAELDSDNVQAEVAIDSLHIQECPDESVSRLVSPNSSQDHNNPDHRPTSEVSHPTQRKPNRQKARLARRAAEQEARTQTAAREAATLPDLRNQEMAAMQKNFEKLGFKELLIRPDGHCMYSAVALLLQHSTSSNDKGKFGTGGLLPYQAVRVETAQFITDHAADFEAFLEEPIAQYTHKIKNTTEWGGQLELQAIARAYLVDINVLQADGRIERILCETEAAFEPLWLTYYRHSFGLGEHYNVLTKDPCGDRLWENSPKFKDHVQER